MVFPCDVLFLFKKQFLTQIKGIEFVDVTRFVKPFVVEF